MTAIDAALGGVPQTPTHGAGKDLLARPWPWPRGADARAQWVAWAAGAAAELAARALPVREAVVVVPVGALVPLVRSAWAASVGGWLPRIDTVAGLMADVMWEHAPRAVAGWPRVVMDPVLDALQAGRLLAQIDWAREWAQTDPRAHEHAVVQSVALVHMWLRRLQGCAPAERAALAARWREAFPPIVSPGAPGWREQRLTAWSLEWALACASQGFASDALFAWRPSAWLAVTAGTSVAPGSEGAVTVAILQQAYAGGQPVFWWAAEAHFDSQQPDGDGASADRPPGLTICNDAEDEAQACAARLLAQVARGRAQAGGGRTPDPAALVALDRSLIRRVRALLDEHGVVQADETGWKLSTTRAAAAVTRMVAAANPRATTDELLDWLKSGWVDLARAAPDGQTWSREQARRAVGALEAWCRRHGLMGAWQLVAVLPEEAGELPDPALPRLPDGRQAMPDEAMAVWRWAQARLAGLLKRWQGGTGALQRWLSASHEALTESGAWAALQADPAGDCLCRALRFDVAEAIDGGEGWLQLSKQTRLDGSGFMRWLATTLEGVVFRPPAPEGAAEVVVTTLARAVLRPFSMVVMPGADERHLGALPVADGWLSARELARLDLATPATLHAAQWEAFSLVMTQGDVVALHRRADGAEGREGSAWLTRWALASAQAWQLADDARVAAEVMPRPTVRPAPRLDTAAVQAGEQPALPDRVSATAYHALRQCPYRFYARVVLGLREQDELEEGLDASDYGNWLHEVLRSFHAEREAQLALRTPDEEVAAWLRAAEQVARDHGMDRDAQRPYFRPFLASLPSLARAYVNWLMAHERERWGLRHSEWAVALTVPTGPHDSVTLEGRLDRLDVRHGPAGAERFVLDYKTGSLSRLKQAVQQPLEDTQLVFYALLGGADDPVQAAYLHLAPGAVTAVAHADVRDHADVLLSGLTHDWQRLREGAPMPALGEGGLCERCEARGLCRKDHWPKEPFTS